MPARTIVVAISDTHIGGSTALCPPQFTTHTGRKDETQITQYNNLQKWLYACWTDFWKYAIELAGIRGKSRHHRLIVLHLGDCVDGLHHHSPQVMNEVEDQVEAACNMLRPIASIADKMFLTYGTGAHNGGTAELETAIGSELGIRHDWEFALDIDGVTFDIAHHGRASRRDWSSSAANVAAEVALDYVSANLKPPRYVLRGHNHCIDDSGIKNPYTRAIALPSWQLRTAFGYKVAASKKRSDIGGIIFDTSNPDVPIFNKSRYEAPRETRKMEKV